MRIMRIFGRNIRDAVRNVFRNFALSLASISAITITLIVVAVSLILTYNVNHTAEILTKNIEIIVFLERDVEEEKIALVEEEIKAIENVETVAFKSKTDIAEEYMAESDVFSAIMEGWSDEDNPLQDTFIIRVKDNSIIGTTADLISQIEMVTAVNYGKGMVEKLLEIFEGIKNVSVIAIGSLVLVTGFLISNTIKITIFSRRREIEIMRLVGASNLNIKIPFVFEGLFLGIIGSILPIVIAFYGYNRLFDYDLNLIMPIIELIEPMPFIYNISLILLAIGVGVGMLASWRAVQKHLKI